MNGSWRRWWCILRFPLIIGAVLLLAAQVDAATLKAPAKPLSKAQSSDSCPKEAYDAAKTMWLMGPTGIGQNRQRIVGKHRCGRWIQCVRSSGGRNGWQCRYSTSKAP